MAQKPISLEDIESGSMTAEELNQELPEDQQVEQPQEEPVEQPPVEETRSQQVEQPVEEQPEAPVEEPKVDEPAPQFNFAELNRSLSKNYESIDQIKADIEKPTMESEYNETKAQLDELQAKYEDLNKTYELVAENIDALTLPVGEDELRMAVFKKENPDKDPSIAQKVLATEDLSSIDDLDMVKLGWRFNTSRLKGTDRDLEISIAEELGQDADTPVSEWPVSAQNRLARMAAEYTNQFKQLRSSITLPERVNIDELKAQRKQAEEQRLTTLNEGWGKVAEESLKATSSIKLPVGEPKEGEEQQYFEWEVAPPKEEVESLKASYIALGLDPDKNKETFQAALDQALFYKNRAMILKKYGEDLLAAQEEKHLEETHNPNPLKDSQRTEPSGDEKNLKERTAFATDGLMPKVGRGLMYKTVK